MKIMTSAFAPVAVGLLLLVGCIAAPTPESARQTWEPKGNANQTDPVWTVLRRREADPSKPLTLADLTDLALHNQAATREAWHKARAAAAQVDQAQGLFMPVVTATVSGTRQGVSASPDTFDSESLRWGPGLQVNYLIVNFGGGRAAAVKQALQTVYAANYTFNQTLQDVLLSVETAYYAQISAEAAVTAAVAGVTDAAQALETAQARSKAGVGTELDILQARTAHDQALFNQAAARGQLRAAQGALAVAVGLPADTRLVTVPPTEEIPPRLDSADIRRMVNEAIGRRADIAALRANLEARHAAVQVAHAGSWPSLYLSGGVSRDFATWYEGAPNAGDRDWSYSVGLRLSWTLFDGWQTESEIRIAEEQAKAAQAQLEQAELAASADVWTRFHAYETAQEKVHFSTAFLASATAAQSLAKEAYRAGLKTFLDQLTADTQLALARSQQIAARQEVFTALIGLAHAAGLLREGPFGGASTLFADTQRKEIQP